MTEKEIENEILDYLNLRTRGFFWKNQSVGIYDPRKKVFRKTRNRHHVRGVSDIIGVFPSGQFVAIEVKTKKGRVSQHQKFFLDNINYMGGIAFVARSLDDVITVFSKLDADKINKV